MGFVTVYRTASELIPPPNSSYTRDKKGNSEWKQLATNEKLSKIFEAAANESVEAQQELRDVIFSRFHDLEDYKELSSGNAILEIAKQTATVPKKAKEKPVTAQTFALQLGEGQTLVLPEYYKAALAKDFPFFETLFYGGFRKPENNSYALQSEEFNNLPAIIGLWDGSLTPETLGDPKAEDRYIEAIDKAIDILASGLDEMIGFDLSAVNQFIVTYLQNKSQSMPDEGDLEEIKYLLERLPNREDIREELAKRLIFIFKGLNRSEFAIPSDSSEVTPLDADNPLLQQKAEYRDLLTSPKFAPALIKYIRDKSNDLPDAGNLTEIKSLIALLADHKEIREEVIKHLSFITEVLINKRFEHHYKTKTGFTYAIERTETLAEDHPLMLQKAAYMDLLRGLDAHSAELRTVGVPEFKEFLSCFPLLRSIRLSREWQPIVRDHNQENVYSILGSLPLESITFDSCGLDPDGLHLLRNSTLLRSVSLVSCQAHLAATFKDALKGFINNEHLEHLNLTNLALTPDDLPALNELLAASKRLKNLDLEGLDVMEPTLEALKECSQLETLNLWKNPLLRGNLTKIGHLENLKHLNLGGCELSSRDIAQIKFPKLETLDLSANPMLKDSDIKTLIENNPNLKELRLKNNYKITNEGLKHLIGSKIEILDYSGHQDLDESEPGFFNQETVQVLNQCHSLKKLILNKTYYPIPGLLKREITVERVVGRTYMNVGSE